MRFSFESSLWLTSLANGFREFDKRLSHCLIVRPNFRFLFVVHLGSQSFFIEFALFLFVIVLFLQVFVLES